MAGFKWVGTMSSGDPNGKVKQYAVESSHAGVLGPGDVVLITAASNAAGEPTVDVGTANSANTGIITGVEPNIASEALSQTWLSATTAGYVWVNVDPFALWEADVSNGPLAAADVGLNVPAVVTAGTVSGSLFTSNMGVNATGKDVTATLPFKVIALLRDDNGVLGNRALVMTNASTYNIGATGV
jgi:hypothetical protein